MYENTNTRKFYKSDLLYPELSYKIIGILFDVFKNLGSGLREKEYQKALLVAFNASGIKFTKEFAIRIKYRGRFLRINYVDFLIEERIILELKQGDAFHKNDIAQVYSYLKAAGLKLGILARFTHGGVKFKRIINIKEIS